MLLSRVPLSRSKVYILRRWPVQVPFLAFLQCNARLIVVPHPKELVTATCRLDTVNALGSIEITKILTAIDIRILSFANSTAIKLWNNWSSGRWGDAILLRETPEQKGATFEDVVPTGI
ncbi:uncharacterized protein CIMG_13064 [Coccidioides immitis RS]|uniref:Uncharacterized protein n=1 Tax=Coccidioides immitis (strain RS) TaxID=246410 RepID=A0A0D8JWC1_COCIM|nr:uncharacterized protein CIMG_13064 [Coccidioides immitis RS]KJF60593.1 hypothetical protein CIMG_13064 [Coccidioides immitis RS]